MQHRVVRMRCLTSCWYLTDSWHWLYQHALLAFLTSVPLYVHPGWSFRSSGCCKWSASFSSQVTLLFSIDGPMLADRHLLSRRQWNSHGVYFSIERLKNTWPSRRLPSTGSKNLRRRGQPTANKKEKTKQKQKTKGLVKFWNRYVERDHDVRVELNRENHIFENCQSLTSFLKNTLL